MVAIVNGGGGGGVSLADSEEIKGRVVGGGGL